MIREMLLHKMKDAATKRFLKSRGTQLSMGKYQLHIVIDTSERMTKG